MTVTPRDCMAGDWELFELTPTCARWRLDLGDRYAIMTQHVVDEELVELNRQELNDSETQKKRFGDGKVIARVPMDVLYSGEFLEKQKQGDREFTKWWLGRPENRPFRTFRGKL